MSSFLSIHVLCSSPMTIVHECTFIAVVEVHFCTCTHLCFKVMMEFVVRINISLCLLKL